MKPRPGVSVGVAFALLAGGAAAQTPDGGSDPQPAALHRAWLAEVLDLDTEAAARQYARIARDGRHGTGERWLAAARLAELQRLGIATPSAPGLAEAPSSLRSSLGPLLPAFEAGTLALQLAIDRSVTVHDLANAPAALPDLRPYVARVEAWQLAQTGPSLRDRQRQRQQAFANLSRSPQVNAYLQRLYATTIVSAELDGRRSQADALRALYFAAWKPPEGVGQDLADDQQVVTKAQANLAAWLEERTLSRQQRTVLTALAEHLAKRAAAGEWTSARELLQRLPRTAERLLARN